MTETTSTSTDCIEKPVTRSINKHVQNSADLVFGMFTHSYTFLECKQNN